MENLKLWWNFIKYSTKFNGEAANRLRIYYVQRCKELSTNLELPKKNFGPSVMCSYCGSLWSKNKPQIKIIHGKGCSKSVKRIIKAHSKNNEISKFQATLMKKSIKNEKDIVNIKCSVCSHNTKIFCNKPKKSKLYKKQINETKLSISQKKKKRKKDKTAGLNLSNIKSPNINEKHKIVPVNSTPTIGIKNLNKNKPSSLNKMRKINLNKINYILDGNKVKKSKINLSNFLQELY